MKHADFYIGLEFVASAGHRWRCTDVGSRTILAIHLDRDDPNWHQGPPYIAKEVVFDEHDLPSCHLTEADALAYAVEVHHTSDHPGYPADAVMHMLEASQTPSYPHANVLRFDRVRPDGEILHPFAGQRYDKGEWFIELYLPFQDTYDVMLERDFIALPRAESNDLRYRARKP